jgi:hypothetical protein
MELLPPDIKADIGGYLCSWVDDIFIAGELLHHMPEFKDDKEWQTMAWTEARHKLCLFFEKNRLWRYPLLTSTAVHASSGQTIADGDDILICLCNLKLIDTTKASWEQILEFRKDEESRRALRRLRLFLVSNYQDKDATYIRDDIEQRVDDYEATVRKWGWETTIATLSCILSSKSLIASAGAALMCALMGRPELVVAAIGSEAVIETGRVAIELARRRLEIADIKRIHPVTYLITAKKSVVRLVHP